MFDQSFLEMRRKVLEEEKREEEKWRTEALSKAKAVAKWLKENYTIKDVYLYGSLAWGGFGKHSDIDILVQGFKDKEHYWQMQSGAENIARPFELNLLCKEEVPPALWRKVKAKGIRLT
ncbi:MAG: nucleotidyltransferase family protein [Moorellaceae bacterium]